MNLKHAFQLALAATLLTGVAVAGPKGEAKSAPKANKTEAKAKERGGWKSPDTDKDGKISAAEAKAAGITDERFKAMDTDGDGYVTEAEKKAARAARMEAKGKEAKEGKEGKEDKDDDGDEHEGRKPRGEGHKGPHGPKPEATPAPTPVPAGT